MKHRVLKSTLAAGLLFALAGPVLAHDDDDRQPNAQEKQAIESTLRAAGYTSWEEIEFDDGVWEVDDARKGQDRTDYDIKINPETWEIISARKD